MRRRHFLGAAAAASILRSFAAAAQPTDRRRLGVLMSTAESPRERSAVAAFVATLAKLGWAAGRNLDLTIRWGGGDAERMRANAREIVALAPDAILVKGANLPALRALNATIPTVFVVLTDVVARRNVASFARPGGNLTGFSSDERDLVGKRLQLLRTISPAVSRVLYLRGSRRGTEALFRQAAEDGKALGVAVADGRAGDEAEIAQAVARFANGPDRGLVVAFDAFTTVHRAQIIDLAARYRLPAVYPLDFFAEDGGLMAYSFDQTDMFRRAASYVDRILRGADPGALPVQFPTRYRLVVNRRTATALGLSVPPLIVAQADEVIE